MRIRLLYLVIALFAAPSLMAQEPADSAYMPKRRFLRSASQLLLTELAPWSYNRFARKAEFAKVNFKSIGENLKPSSWEWDDNSFQTNQFAHPYHGNLYFNSFRSNGYNFWQSAPAAFAGSFLWEIAGETHKPAPNDFINTSLGGIALGEMTYRISNKIVNPRAHGMQRQVQEVLGLLVNPLNGLNRIINGNWGRVYGSRDTINNVSGYIDIGVRHFNIHTLNEYTNGNNELYLRLQLNYGEKYKISNIPFQHFTARVEVGGGDSTYMNTVQVSGALKTWILREDSSQQHLYSVTMNYDFIKNNAFEYGGQSFTFKLLSNWSKRHKTKIFTEIGSGIIVLGAVPDKYLFYGEGRNYDYGPGIMVTANIAASFNNRLEASLNYRGSRFSTLNGSESSYILNTLSADMRLHLNNRFSLTAGIGQYTLNGFYKNKANIAEIYPFGRAAIGYSFK